MNLLGPARIQGHQALAVVAGLTAVEQGGDAVRIDLQHRHFLPEPTAELPIGTHEHGFGQLTDQGEHQLLLLEFGETGRERSPGPAAAAGTGSTIRRAFGGGVALVHGVLVLTAVSPSLLEGAPLPHQALPIKRINGDSFQSNSAQRRRLMALGPSL